MKSKYFYPAILEKDENGYSIWINDLIGCNSHGKTIEDAFKKIKEALGLYLEVFMEENKELPEPSLPENIKIEQNQFLAIVDFDWLEYQKKYCSKAVKKTLTIPMYLNIMAEKEHINFSSVLREALENILKTN